jgi:hypothetical protein
MGAGVSGGGVRWRQVALLYAVLAVLAGEHWVFGRRPSPAQPPDAVRPRFLAVAADEVRELRLVRGDRRVVCRRDGERWSVVEPPGAPIPPDLIAAFANALTGAEEIQRVGGAGDDLAAYGFDERALRLEVIGGRGGPVVVTLGGTNPPGTAVYARRIGAPEIVLIGRSIRYYEDLIFQTLAAHPPEVDDGARVGG